MSASTVAISANPAVNNSHSLALGSKPNARRRTVVVAEKKSNIEIVGEGGIAEMGVDEKVVSGMDVRNSIRGDLVLERPKDLLQMKKNFVDSTISPRRSRKVVPKPEKSRWQTVLSVFMKNFLLLLVLLGLVHMIRKLALKSGDTSLGPMGISDVEGRIAEVEAFLKTTMSMMQVQVEVVDRKIESGVGGLRRELAKKVEEKGVLFENELKKLEVKTDSLDKSLGELKATGFFTKEDFDRFLDELKNSKSLEDNDRNWSLDEIRAFAREIVGKEIEKHAADGLGRVDYALASGGAMVFRNSEPYISGKSSNWFPVTGRNGVHSDAQKMLQPSFGEPGQCFPLKGSNGFVEIKLRKTIIPEAITVEHVAKVISRVRDSVEVESASPLEEGDSIGDQDNRFSESENSHDGSSDEEGLWRMQVAEPKVVEERLEEVETGSVGSIAKEAEEGRLTRREFLANVARSMESVAYDRSSAPKDCRVSAWLEARDADPSIQVENMILLAEFTYDLEKSNAQTFSVESVGSGLINTVRLDFTSNHGSLSHTCIYRLRVHGQEPNSVAMLAMQS
ncbi:hypothetical protein HHK36_019568 [Tetracentron sinense]|uniref:SUN domain-containing protein n=1 Tax=Tetracentron sinense TaxID=13715 RepID=A0A834Z053_TETSI|nr:hypothetical protein HHK36_019568 [Tetracentron sinense]